MNIYATTALLAEYRDVLLRPKIRKVHGLDERAIDLPLTEIATHAIVREPEAASGAPDPKGDHLWALLIGVSGSALVTGDLVLARIPPAGSKLISARPFLRSLAASQRRG